MAENVVQISERITREEVFEICELLAKQYKDEGIEKTVSRRDVWLYIKHTSGRTPSMKTINNHVGAWEDSLQTRVEACDIDLTPTQIEAFLAFGRQVLREVTETVRRDAAEREKKLEEQRLDAIRQTDKMAEDYDLHVNTTLAELGGKDAEIRHLTEELKKADSELRASKEAISTLNNTITRLTERSEIAQQRAQTAEAQIEGANRKAAEAEGRAAALTDDLQKSRAENLEKNKRIVELADQNAENIAIQRETKAKLTAAEKEIDRLNKELSAALVRIQVEENVAVEANKQISVEQRARVEAERRVATLEGRISELSSRLNPPKIMNESNES